MGCLAPYLHSFDRVLRAEHKAEATRKTYLDRAAKLDAWLERLPGSYLEAVPDACGQDGQDLPVPQEPNDVTRAHISGYIEAVVARTSAATGSNHYRALQQFFKFLTLEEVIDWDPFGKLRPPHVVDKPVPVIRHDVLWILLGACKGRGLAELRDTAIIMVLLDIGLRRGELAGLDYAEKPEAGDVDLVFDVLNVRGKGGWCRVAPFGDTAGLAIECYIRKRNRVLRAADMQVDGPLWITVKTMKRLTGEGIARMLDRRCDQAEIRRINPHRFRHTFAHEFRVDNSDDETDLMYLMGWRSRQMLSRYGASAAAVRARAAHRKNSPCDRLFTEMHQRPRRR